MAETIDKRVILHSVGAGEPASKEQLAGWLLSWLAHGDVNGYAKKIKQQMKEADLDEGGAMQEVRPQDVRGSESHLQSAVGG